MVRVLVASLLFAVAGCGGAGATMQIESSSYGKNDLIRDAFMGLHSARSKSCGQPAIDDRRVVVEKRTTPHREERREDTLVTVKGTFRCGR